MKSLSFTASAIPLNAFPPTRNSPKTPQKAGCASASKIANKPKKVATNRSANVYLGSAPISPPLNVTTAHSQSLFTERSLFAPQINPLSPPCIPPKFVLHGLSSKSKFLAVSLAGLALLRRRCRSIPDFNTSKNSPGIILRELFIFFRGLEDSKL